MRSNDFYYTVSRDAHYLTIRVYDKLESYKWDLQAVADYRMDYEGKEEFSVAPTPVGQSALEFAQRLCLVLTKAGMN